MALVSLPNMWVLTPRLVTFTRAVRFKLSGGDTPPLRGEATRLRGSQPCTPSHRSGAAGSGFAPRACLRLWSLACCSQLPLSPGPGHLLLPCLWEFPSSASQSVTLCKLLVDGGGGASWGRAGGLRAETRGSQDTCQLTGYSPAFTFLTLAVPLGLPLGINLTPKRLGAMRVFQ